MGGVAGAGSNHFHAQPEFLLWQLSADSAGSFWSRSEVELERSLSGSRTCVATWPAPRPTLRRIKTAERSDVEVKLSVPAGLNTFDSEGLNNCSGADVIKLFTTVIYEFSC